MNRFKLSRRSKAALKGVHPKLVEVVELAITLTHVDFYVSEGVRDLERQAKLVEQGVSKTLRSKHLVQADGFGHAVDLVATGDLNGDGKIDAQDSKLVWDKRLYHEIAVAVKAAADELGVAMRWGGDFKSFFDGPHFELIHG